MHNTDRRKVTVSSLIDELLMSHSVSQSLTLSLSQSLTHSLTHERPPSGRGAARRPSAPLCASSTLQTVDDRPRCADRSGHAHQRLSMTKSISQSATQSVAQSVLPTRHSPLTQSVASRSAVVSDRVEAQRLRAGHPVGQQRREQRVGLRLRRGGPARRGAEEWMGEQLGQPVRRGSAVAQQQKTLGEPHVLCVDT
eukprot:Selendium_serpulae@DN4615_c2_g1_i1.p1